MRLQNKIRIYDTVSEAVADLTQRGYVENFNLKENCLECREHGIYLKPEDFVIDEIHRFEGETDPGDENIVYAISSRRYGLKGILVNAFGTYSDPVSSDIVSKLRVAEEVH